MVSKELCIVKLTSTRTISALSQFWYVDTPNTSTITYTPIVRNGYTGGSGTFYYNRDFGYYNYQSYRVGGSRRP